MFAIPPFFLASPRLVPREGFKWLCPVHGNHNYFCFVSMGKTHLSFASKNYLLCVYETILISMFRPKLFVSHLTLVRIHIRISNVSNRRTLTEV